MELYGSLFNISGSVTASAFTGSYIGDGAGLYNLPASGVTGLNLSQISSGSSIASITPTGFTVNTNTTITGSLIVTGTVLSETTTLVSGSSQITITGTTGYSTFSSSIATTDLNQSNRLNSIEGVTGSYATTGSNTFKGTQNVSGSIIPTIDNAFDLGSPTYQWRDVYISSGSLYIDGTKVISSTTQELTITTDTGQSIKILEGTTDSIILQVADGDIELKSSGDGDILLDPTNGKIMLKGAVEILNGQKIQSSVGGTPVVFANDIVVSGSIDITGTIEGINLTDFSSSVNTRVSNLESGAGSLNSFTASANNRLSSIETTTSSLNSYTSSNDTTNTGQNTRIGLLETASGSLNSYTSSNDTTNTGQNTRLGLLETASGSLNSFTTSISNAIELTGSNLTVKGDLLVKGTTTQVDSTTVNIGDNIVQLNGTGATNAGIVVRDAIAPNTISGSLLWDTTNDYWIAGPLGSEQRLVRETEFNNSVTRIGNIETATASLNSFTSSINTTIKSKLNSDGVVSGSSQISFNGITDKPTLVSGSSQITYGSLSGIPSGIVSGSSQITYGSLSEIPSGIVSGSSQITFGSVSGIPGGLVSGSSQIDLTSTTNYSTGIKTRLNVEGVISGSSQVTGIGNAQLTNSSFYVGTTSISLGRASASQTLTGVSIDGNAATATSATSASSATNSTNAGYLGTTDLRTIAPNSHDAYKLKFGFTSFNNNNTSPYADYLHLRSYSDNSGGSDNLVMFSKSGIGMRIWQQTFGSATAYSSYKDVAWTDGTNSSGTWGISISGNAATVGNFTPSQTSGTANRIVVADANGYIVNNYFNASGGGSERNASGMGYFAGHNSSDYYYRSYTAAAAAALLSGQSMNISGTATNITQYTINQSVGTGNAPTFAGGTINGSLYVNANNDVTTLAGSLTLYSSGNATTSMIMFKNTTGLGYGNHGAITGTYNTYFVMDTTDRGWIWRNATTSTNVASISNTGVLTTSSGAVINGDLLVNGNWSTNSPTSYSEAFTIQGTYPSMAFRSTTSSKMWLHHMQSDGALTWYHDSGNYTTENWSQKLQLMTNGTLYSQSTGDLGTSTYRWGNVYTNDLHLSNEGKEGGNDVDGTTGDWTIQEGEENLYIINNKNGKKFKMDLTEIV